MRKAIVFLVMICFSLIASNLVYAQAEKFVFVDLGRTFDEYKKTEKYDKQLQEHKDAKVSEREKKVKEIKDLQDKLSVLSKTEKDNTQAAIDAKLKSLQEFDAQIQIDLKREYEDMLKEIVKEIEKSIREYAEKNGFTFIFKDQALLYGSKTLDVTEDIIKSLNEKYTPTSKK